MFASYIDLLRKSAHRGSSPSSTSRIIISLLTVFAKLREVDDTKPRLELGMTLYWVVSFVRIHKIMQERRDAPQTNNLMIYASRLCCQGSKKVQPR
jgi:hypothetical protein